MDPEKWMKGIASILWPILIAVLLFKFSPAVQSIVDSAKSREFSIEIGGQKLSMKEANDQNQKLITDLQKQVVDLKKSFDEKPWVDQSHKIKTTTAAVQEKRTKQLQQKAALRERAVLWVDDVPKNNSYFIQRLQEARIPVDLAISTSDALAKLNTNNYSVIISDMGREEGEGFQADAGIALLKRVRQINKDIRFIVFSSSASSSDKGQIALKFGATAVTSSPTELFEILGLDRAKE